MIQLARNLLVRHSGVNWALGDQALISGVNFLTGIMLARFLGLEDFGRFTLAWMAVQFVNAIQFAVVSAPMLNIGPKQGAADRPAYFGAVLIQQVCFAALASALLWACASTAGTVFPDWRAGELALPLACAAFGFQMQDFVRRYFFTVDRGSAAAVNDALRYLSQIVLLGALFAGPGLDSRSALWIIAGCALASAGLGLVSMERLEWRRDVFASVAARHWRFGRWLSASAAMHWFSGNLFIVAAGVILGPVAVGGLRAAQNLMGITHILFQGFENVAPVRAARHLERAGTAALTAFLGKLAAAVAAPTAVVALVAAAAPELWLGLIYHEQFTAYGGVLRWYALIYLVMALILPLRTGLYALEDTKPIFLANVASLGFAVVTCYWFVNTFGIFGSLYGILGMNILIQIVTLLGLRSALARRRG